MNELQINPGHYDEGGPVEAATAFFDAACASDFPQCWSMWTTELRRAAAERWVDANLEAIQEAQPRERDDLVDALAGANNPDTLTGLDRQLWEGFEYTQLYSMSTAWAEFIELNERGRLGAGSATRLISPGRERVILTETDPEQLTVHTEPTEVVAVQVDVEWTGDRWLIAEIL